MECLERTVTVFSRLLFIYPRDLAGLFEPSQYKRACYFWFMNFFNNPNHFI